MTAFNLVHKHDIHVREQKVYATAAAMHKTTLLADLGVGQTILQSVPG